LDHRRANPPPSLLSPAKLEAKPRNKIKLTQAIEFSGKIAITAKHRFRFLPTIAKPAS
jgi:hypothetical protein